MTESPVAWILSSAEDGLVAARFQRALLGVGIRVLPIARAQPAPFLDLMRFATDPTQPDVVFLIVGNETARDLQVGFLLATLVSRGTVTHGRLVPVLISAKQRYRSVWLRTHPYVDATVGDIDACAQAIAENLLDTSPFARLGLHPPHEAPGHDGSFSGRDPEASAAHAIRELRFVHHVLIGAMVSLTLVLAMLVATLSRAREATILVELLLGSLCLFVGYYLGRLAMRVFRRGLTL